MLSEGAVLVQTAEEIRKFSPSFWKVTISAKKDKENLFKVE